MIGNSDDFLRRILQLLLLFLWLLFFLLFAPIIVVFLFHTELSEAFKLYLSFDMSIELPLDFHPTCGFDLRPDIPLTLK